MSSHLPQQTEPSDLNSLLQYFPYSQTRQIQKEALQVLSDEWSNYDVFVLGAPTAFGKTAVAKTLMNAGHSVSVITPTNLLVNQFLDEFPDTPTLKRLDSYYCEEWDRSCAETRGKTRGFCKKCDRTPTGCPASGALATAKYRRGPGIYNYHIYYAHKIYRDVLVVDEAHNLIPFIKELQAVRLWQHDYKYPDNMFKPEQVLAWIEKLPPKQQAGKKIQLLRQAVAYKVPTHVFSRTTEQFNGKGTLRGEPEMRDCIKLLPVDISESPPAMWPREVQKVILLSATIGQKDVESLGLNRGKRVLYIECKSPISSERRPIYSIAATSVNRENIDEASKILVKEIGKIADKYPESKGVIHATYQLSSILSVALTGDRYLFHDRSNKSEVYEYFRSLPPGSGAVLVACGMYEGIDLPEDLGRFQIIAKIPWPSLGNPGVKHMSELDPEWYLWETAKTVIQACGRICRTPEDYGETYVLDSSYERLLEEAEHLLPEWYKEAILWQKVD